MGSCIAVLILLFVTNIGLVSSRFEREKLEINLENKWQLSKAGLKMFMTKPAIGIGHEGYRDNYKKYFPNSSKERRPVHNIFVKVLAEYGLIGFVPFILIFFYPLLLSIKIIRFNKYLKNKGDVLNLAIFCIATVIPFMLIGWFAGGLYSNKYVFKVLYTNIALFITYVSHEVNKNAKTI
jgi:O-antigen ligase